MNRVLIVWSLVPEEIAKFLCLELDNETFNKVVRFHNKYINDGLTSRELTQEMNDFFYDEDGNFLFKDKMVEESLFGQTYDLIVCCGFIL